MTFTTISPKLVVLGTGGTIAGTALHASDNIGYKAAQVSISQLMEAVPGLSQTLSSCTLVMEQVAQIDSKDMSFSVWRLLALRVLHYLAQADVKGVLITHGTDTLEETAFFLQAVLPIAHLANKPVVLTCAMRPASALVPDGPQNVMDACAVALTPGACGVLVVCAGTVHSAIDVQKVHTYRLDAFDSGDAGPLGYVEEGALRLVKSWPTSGSYFVPCSIEMMTHEIDWPRVDIVMNYAGATGDMVDALVYSASHAPVNSGDPSESSLPLRGLVVAATGNGSVHHSLEAALRRAQLAGVKVVLATRCSRGRVLPVVGSVFLDSKGLSPVKARVALTLELLSRAATGD